MKHRLATIALSLLATTTAHAESLRLEHAKLELDVPAGWTSTAIDSGFVMESPNGRSEIYVVDGWDDEWALFDALEASVHEKFPGLAFDDMNDEALDDDGLSIDSEWTMSTLDGVDYGVMAGVILTASGTYAGMIILDDHSTEDTLDPLYSIRDLSGDRDVADPFAALPSDVADFARGLSDAIDANDAKAFLKLIPAKLEVGHKKVKKAKVKSALKKWKKKGGIAAYLGLAAGAWNVIQPVDGFDYYFLFRDDGTGSATYVAISRVKGAWRATGTGRFETLA